MSEDIGAAGASALVTGHMSDRMSSRIAVVGGRRRWSVDQKLSILREAFGPDGSVSATCQRHAVGSGLLYTWRRQALAGDLTGAKRTPAPSFAEVEGQWEWQGISDTPSNSGCGRAFGASQTTVEDSEAR